MSEYVMDAGARLELGPGGKPYEELGACCAGCASGTSCGKPLGAVSVAGLSIPTPVLIGAAGLAAYLLFFRRKSRRRRGYFRGRRRRNPATFTKKGERMYRHIKAGYGSEPRAKEIAARTVYAAAARGTHGLVRKRRR